jgi:hypothetical protein
VNFRKAARQFFMGSAETNSNPESPAAKQQVTIVRKAPKAKSGGGC